MTQDSTPSAQVRRAPDGACPESDAGRREVAPSTPIATRHFDFSTLTGAERYRLLASTIMPRPIAWVVTRSPNGVVNAAPYSFFNLFGADRPVVALGILAREGGSKDTLVNIRATGEFVVNLVPFSQVEAMNVTCVDAPPHVDEIALAGLATVPSLEIGPPRIALSPVAFECRLMHLLETGPGQMLAVGEILHAHYDIRALVGDPDRPRVDPAALDLVGRMHGASTYLRTRDLFDLPRPVWHAEADLHAPSVQRERSK